jgi:hypothetical protein
MLRNKDLDLDRLGLAKGKHLQCNVVVFGMLEPWPGCSGADWARGRIAA